MRILTGLQPSGKLHIGNYFGSIKAMLDAQKDNEMFIFIANYHALTSINDNKNLKRNTFEAACAFLALGIDPQKSIFYVQSDIKEVLELYWILSQYAPMGLMQRAHSYKDKVSKGINASHGLFSYPILMAADILLFNPDIVPVGKDQIQHIEIARDIAIKFNNEKGEIFKIPQAKIDENLALVLGTDGEKMSKSYKNTIDIFGDEKNLKKQISAIKTDSKALDEIKDYQNCNIYKIAKLFLNKDEQKQLENRYLSAKEGYGHFKIYLNEIILSYFSQAREKFNYYLSNEKLVNEILEQGALKAKKIASPFIQKIRDISGI